MTAIEFEGHPLLANLVVQPQDMGEELPAQDQGIAELDFLGIEPGIELVDDLDVVADDVVAHQEVSLSQDVDPGDDGFVGALVVVLGNQSGVEITDHEAVDRVEPLPHEAVGL